MRGITIFLVLITVLVTGCSETYEKTDTDADGRKLMLAETTQYLFNYEHNSKDTSSESADFINKCLDIYSGDDISDYKLLVTYIEMDDIEHVKELQRKLGGDIIE